MSKILYSGHLFIYLIKRDNEKMDFFRFLSLYFLIYFLLRKMDQWKPIFQSKLNFKRGKVVNRTLFFIYLFKTLSYLCSALSNSPVVKLKSLLNESFYFFHPLCLIKVLSSMGGVLSVPKRSLWRGLKLSIDIRCFFQLLLYCRCCWFRQSGISHASSVENVWEMPSRNSRCRPRSIKE